jgi:uncharacterized protein (DUF433 family)
VLIGVLTSEAEFTTARTVCELQIALLIAGLETAKRPCWILIGCPANHHVTNGDNYINEDNRMVIDPAICHGKPEIRGTRMPVSLVVGSLAGGMTFEELQQEYDLTVEDIRAALKFVGKLAHQESIDLLPA